VGLVSWLKLVGVDCACRGLCCTEGMTPEQRKEGYACDVTYVTNSEIGFDFLRDNLAVVSGTGDLTA